MNISQEIKSIALDAKKASVELRRLSTEVKNKTLEQMARALVANSAYILKANKRDIQAAKRAGLKDSFVDRLSLNKDRIREMSACLREIAGQQDPIGSVISSAKRPNGLQIMKVRVPLGVIGVIYESRPNVTSDCIGLCLKSGNAIILRGGSSAIYSNMAIFDILNKVALRNGLPRAAISIVKTTDRKAVRLLLKEEKNIDLIIPRGGESLIKEVVKYSKIPVIKHYKGLCHAYVDEYADLNMAANIVINAKLQRTSVCNAIETLLVHKHIAARFLPLLVKNLKSQGTEIRGCIETNNILKGTVKKATQKDWETEYLDKIISIRVVNSINEAIEHIERYSSGLSEVIITDSCESAEYFLNRVDSACVYLNASTRFTDGNQFGLGAEIGISTGRMHARGPMGAAELTSYKYVIVGNGQTRTK
jgi:glutamate-5-semialdehyde dehydrogenase